MTVPEPAPMQMVPPPVQEEEEPFHPPKVLLKHMSIALRLTCEWNRRLFAGVNKAFHKFKPRIRNDANESEEPQQPEPPLQPSPQPSLYDDAQPQQLQLEPYGEAPVNIHPNRVWHPPIREGGPDLEQESLTIFHAMIPREDVKTPSGVAYWGPELLPYLEQVSGLLKIDNNGLEIALAMIYLDRACSVDTIRSNGCPPCPYCLPRTVHRLSLVALILAKQAVNGNNGKSVQEYLEDLKPLGIPSDQLELMTNWMINALGDNGSFVTVGQMKLWNEQWEAAFFPKKHRALQQKRQQELQQRLLQQQQEREMEEQRQLEEQQRQYEEQYQEQQAYHQGYPPQKQNYR